MTTMIETLLAWLKEQLGQCYVWGGQGETLSTMRDPEGWIRERETSENNALRAIAFYRACTKNPIRAYDCSGLIVRFLQDQGLLAGDLSSRGLYAACSKIEREELEIGDLVFRHDGSKIYHVGVYVGEDMAIEAKGRDDGVVKRSLNQSGQNYWNRFGRLPLLSGAADREPPAPPAQETPAAQQKPPALPALYRYVGATYVNLRTAPNTSAERIGRVSRGNEVLVLRLENGWADIVQKDGALYRRGWCGAQYLVPAPRAGT